MLFSYQQRIMNSNARINVVQAPRQSGRTHLCMEWLMSSNRGLYVAHTTTAISSLVQKIKHSYPEKIKLDGDRFIEFKNGSKIIFLTHKQVHSVRGHRFDRVAFDNAGYLSWQDGTEVLASLANEGQVLVIGDYATPSSILDYVLNNIGNGGYYDQYTAEEAVDEGVYSKEQYSTAREVLSTEAFRKEFGPWGRITDWHSNRKNRDYLHILNK